MSCSQCKGPLPEYDSEVLTIDGDMACSVKCKKAYELERDHFFSTVINNDDLFDKWITNNER